MHAPITDLCLFSHSSVRQQTAEVSEGPGKLGDETGLRRTSRQGTHATVGKAYMRHVQGPESRGLRRLRICDSAANGHH